MAALLSITRTGSGQYRLDFDASVTFSDATGMSFTIDGQSQTIFAAVGSGSNQPFLIVGGDPGDGVSFDYGFAYDGSGDLSPVSPPLSASNSYTPPAPVWGINNRSRANTYPYHQINTTDAGNLFFSPNGGGPDLPITAIGLPPGIAAVMRTDQSLPIVDLVGTFTQVGVFDIELQYTDELGRIATDGSTTGNFGEDHFKFTLEVGTQAGPGTPPTGIDYIFDVELDNGSTPTAFATSNAAWSEFDARDRSCFVLGNNSGDGGKRVGCLVTQRHVVTAAHYPCAGVGETIRALAEDGTVETRTVDSIATVSDGNGPTDIRVLTLDSALPAKFRPAAIQVSQPAGDAYAVNQDGAIGTRQINAWGGLLSWPTGQDGGDNTEVVRHQEPTIVAVEPTPFVVRTFDSGCPLVAPGDGVYALVGPHLTSTAASQVGAYIDDLNAITSPEVASVVIDTTPAVVDGYQAAIYHDDGAGGFTELARALTITPPPLGEADDTPTRFLKSEGRFATFRGGFADAGECAAAFLYTPDAYSAAAALFKQLKTWRVLFADDMAGGAHAGGVQFQGYLKAPSQPELDGQDRLTFQLAIKATGRPTILPPQSA